MTQQCMTNEQKEGVYKKKWYAERKRKEKGSGRAITKKGIKPKGAPKSKKGQHKEAEGDPLKPACVQDEREESE